MLSLMGLAHSRLFQYRHRLFVLAILVLSTWLSLGLLVARWVMSGHRVYGFLIWNLFLAWIPFWIAAAMYYGHLRQTKRNILLFSLGAMWLLFFPNAPYLWTDLKHLPMTGHDAIWWCDLVMALSFGWNGMLLGLVSMYMVHRIARDRLGATVGWVIAISALALGSFGVSLGRFNRANSWDLFTKPDALLGRMALQMSHPFEHPLLFGMASLFFVFLLLAYITLLALMAMGREEGPALIDQQIAKSA